MAYENPNNVERLRQANVLDPDLLTTEEAQVINALDTEEVDALINVRQQLGGVIPNTRIDQCWIL